MTTLGQFQERIRALFGAKDARRGVEGTFMWFMEEVGELAAALREGPREALALEFADVLAWLATLANIAGIDLDSAIEAKYGRGCPKCAATPCTCREAKP
ncbi:MAG: nucleotide pyrophosphohydrolase [Gemmataceae bacterium]|nr:nucleotide pyrophosphohydrolase [Gemmataceae bacterium]